MEQQLCIIHSLVHDIFSIFAVFIFNRFILYRSNDKTRERFVTLVAFCAFCFQVSVAFCYVFFCGNNKKLWR